MDMLHLVAPWSFLGRSSELNRLINAANAAPGRGVIYSGAAGVGKSRLLRQATSHLDADRLAVWHAVGTNATAGLPLGAVAQMLPPEQPPWGAASGQLGGTSSGLLRWAVDALERQAAGRPMVVTIDDAHLLDPLSAALIYHLARSDRATVLGAVRLGEAAPDSVRALWAEDLVERVELGPLTPDETADLLAQVLGGPVDSATVARLWRLSLGNALLLREVVTGSQASGAITETYGVWRWTGRLELPPTLTELIDARIGQLTPPVRRVLELVAFGEPIGLRLLVKATDSEAVEIAEERHLIEVINEDRRITVRLAHPLYGEVVRRRCPVTRVHRLLADLASLVEGVGARRREDLLRVAVWRLDSDTATDPRQLLTACETAFATYNIPLALRLGRAAMAAARGGELAGIAAQALATVLLFAGQARDGRVLLDDSPPGDWRKELIRIATRFWGLAEVDALASAERKRQELKDPTERSWWLACESSMRLHHDEPATALTLARSVLDSSASRPGARALAQATMAYLQAVRGAPESTLRGLADLDAGITLWHTAAPFLQLPIELARGTAMVLAGDLAAIDARVTGEFAAMVHSGEFRSGSAYLTLLRAQAARLRGALGEAARCANQAAANQAYGGVFGALAHAERAHVAALSGDLTRAVEALAEADRLRQPTMALFYPWVEQARCWVKYCSGQPAAAISIMRELVERLRADGFSAQEVLALHDLIRLGAAGPATERLDDLAASVVERLGVLAGTVEGRMAPVAAWHARARAERDGHGLLAVADELAELELRLYAAEAAAGAVTLLRAARSAQTPTASSRLAQLRAECPDARVATLEVTQPVLTSREQQIAQLAAAGVASKEIADRLYLSSRTVDNHLMRVYAKLGVTGRSELGAALRILPAPDAVRVDSPPRPRLTT